MEFDTATLTNCWGMLAGAVGTGAYPKVVLTNNNGVIRVEIHKEDESIRVIDVKPNPDGIKPFCTFILDEAMTRKEEREKGGA